MTDSLNRALNGRPPAAGFVLAGGMSSRMGSDKAALPFGSKGHGTLLEHVASLVEAATGEVTIVAPPDRYGHLGLRVIADQSPGEGPLGGILTALTVTNAEWNLIVACDMPFVSATLFGRLLEAAAHTEARIVLPLAADRPQPLCAVYHVSTLAPIQHAFSSGIRKVLTALDSIRIEHLPFEAGQFLNMNTPEDWRTAMNRR